MITISAFALSLWAIYIATVIILFIRNVRDDLNETPEYYAKKQDIIANSQFSLKALTALYLLAVLFPVANTLVLIRIIIYKCKKK